MEPGFLNNGARRWQDRIVKPLQQGSSKFTRPSDLVNSSGMFRNARNLKIYVSTPRTRTSTAQRPVLLYQSKVDEILSSFRRTFPNAPVTMRSYQKLTSEEADEITMSARGKVLIEYDNNQIDLDSRGKPKPPTRMYRIWLEDQYYERRF